MENPKRKPLLIHKKALSLSLLLKFYKNTFKGLIDNSKI